LKRFNVRLLRIDDVPQLLPLWSKYCESIGEKVDAGRFLNIVASYLKVPGYMFLVLESGEKVVGFADCLALETFFEPYRIGVSNFIYVLPGRSDGSGFLAGWVIKCLKRMGAKELRISCKDRLVPFWERHKFVEYQHFMKREL